MRGQEQRLDLANHDLGEDFEPASSSYAIEAIQLRAVDIEDADELKSSVNISTHDFDLERAIQAMWPGNFVTSSTRRVEVCFRRRSTHDAASEAIGRRPEKVALETGREPARATFQASKESRSS